jgi:hypothetical protein
LERADLDAAVALLAEDVAFRSPAVFRPYEGREAVATILRAERMGPALRAGGGR